MALRSDRLRTVRTSRAVSLIAAAAVAAGIAVRFAFLGNQSYWADELFSVWQNDGPFARILQFGRQEVHTPFYAFVLWIWIHVVGHDSEAWTHALSAIFGGLAVVLIPLLLARAGVSRAGRWTAAALMATAGFAIVYSDESRSYALALLGSVGVTMIGARWWRGRAAAETSPGGGSGGPAPSRRVYVAWLVSGLVAASAHLYGALLVASVGLVLAFGIFRAGRARAAITPLVLAAVACIPQAVWIVHGKLAIPGFPHEVAWIRPPGLHALDIYATSAFATGGLVQQHGGFQWRSHWGLVALAGVILLSLVCHAASRAQRIGTGYDASAAGGSDSAASGSAATEEDDDAAPDRSGPASTATAEGRASRDADVDVLGYAALTGAVVIAVAFLSSQLPGLHTWTMRNMIVSLPSLYLVVALGCLVLSRRFRDWTALVIVLLCAASLIGVVGNIQQPFKTDFRDAMHELAAVKSADPHARIVISGWAKHKVDRFALEFPRDIPRKKAISWLHAARVIPRKSVTAHPPTLAPGHGFLFWYPGILHQQNARVRQRVLARNRGCRAPVVQGIVTLSC